MKTLENNKFKKKINSLKKHISISLKEMEYDLGLLDIDSLISSNNYFEGGNTIVYPSHKCPPEIKDLITKLIQNEFPIK